MGQVPERLIQDAISRGNRLANLLNGQLHRDWAFNEGDSDQPDVVNQEYWHDGGRIDVLATFNGRSRLVIVETKPGCAGVDAVEQLKWYMDPGRVAKLTTNDPKLASVAECVGILVAEDFDAIPAREHFPSSKDIYLVKFEVTANNGFPFTLVQEVRDAPKKPGRRPYQSRLVYFSDHLDQVRDDALKPFVRGIANCFLADNDPRREWVMVNPKGDHLGIHYKGFDAIRVYTGWNPVTVTINGANYGIPEHEGEVRSAVSKWIGEVDKKMEGIIGGFKWVL